MQALFHQSYGGADRAGIANNQNDERARDLLQLGWAELKVVGNGPQPLPIGTMQAPLALPASSQRSISHARLSALTAAKPENVR